MDICGLSVGKNSIHPGKGGKLMTNCYPWSLKQSSVGNKIGHTEHRSAPRMPQPHLQNQDGEGAHWRWNYCWMRTKPWHREVMVGMVAAQVPEGWEDRPVPPCPSHPLDNTRSCCLTQLVKHAALARHTVNFLNKHLVTRLCAKCVPSATRDRPLMGQLCSKCSIARCRES